MVQDFDTRWRRSADVARKRRVTDTAVDEARLIVASGELALRHAADITQASPTLDKTPLAAFAPYRPVRLLPEVLSYAVSVAFAAVLIAIVLFIVGSRGGVVPLLH